eukprot:gb/GFBE01033027.1/.p1 GENE.gb/GFBE01033027.1/~~gb/GFBE01033027.1/.p1  ORF type:complete len:243 (+),score=40.73 gb/GFBE01033027.1/:1-729(+)
MPLSTQPVAAAWPQQATKPGLVQRSGLTTPRTPAVQKPVLQGEIDSTDAGSCCSDAESGWSSASEVAQPKTPPQLPLQSMQRGKKPGPLGKKVRMVAGKLFRSTPLTPIPGTPVHPSRGVEDADSSSPEQEDVGSEKIMPFQVLAAPVACRVPPGLPTSPKREARQAVIERAFAEGIPLKVRMPEAFAQIMRPLDCNMPAKKRPLFLDGTAAQTASLDPLLPAKKCLTPFLLQPVSLIAHCL